MKDAKGNRLYRHLELVIHFPPPVKKNVRRFRPSGKGAGFTVEGIQSVLEQQAEYLEKRFPLMVFRLVERGPDKFSFIFVEWRIKPEPVAKHEDAQVPPGAAQPLPEPDEAVTDATLPEAGYLNPVSE